MTDILSRRTVIGLAATVASGALLHHQLPRASAAVPNSTFTFTASNGLISECRFYPAGAARAGLVIYLDGDGQQLHDEDHDGDDVHFPGGLTGSGSIVAAATARGHDVVSVRTPSADDTWWQTDLDAKVALLTELLPHLHATYGANTAALWLVGYSGGAEFITRYFFPAHAGSMDAGGFLVFGGGDVPDRSRTDSFSQDAKTDLSLNFVTGEQDQDASYDALGSAKRTAAFYQSVGFEHVWTTWPRGHNHTSITHEFGSYLAVVLDEY